METMISLTLLGVLFVLLGSLLNGISRLSSRVDEFSVTSREVEFCFDLMRKELSEALIDSSNPKFNLLTGSSFISYVTLRDELVSRDSISNGAKLVEWRFDPSQRNLTRKVNQLPGKNRVIMVEKTETLLKGLSRMEVYWKKDDNIWVEAAGVSEAAEKLKAIRVAFIFRDNEAEDAYETTFSLPEENRVNE